MANKRKAHDVLTCWFVPGRQQGEELLPRLHRDRGRVDFMNKFRKLGLIEYNGELRVHSSLLNVVIRE